jgi:hypothetical protein
VSGSRVTDRVQAVALGASVVLLLAVLELVRRRRLAEEYSFFWIGSALLLLGLSLRADVLRAVARWTGVDDPPLVLVLMLLFTVFIASLWFSVIVSRQRKQIERLIEESAILSAEVRDLKNAQDGGVRLEPDRPQASAPNRPRA